MESPVIPRDAGSTMILVIFLLLLLGALALSMSMSIDVRARAARRDIEDSRVEYACEGALRFAYAYVWDSFLQLGKGAAGPLKALKDHLETTLPVALPDGATIDLTADTPDLGVPFQSVTLSRTDRPGGIAVELTARVTANTGTDLLTLSRSFLVSGEDFQGLDFGLLSNNVNCIFCHARVDSVQKYSSANYPQVKVVSLESLLVRTTSADSTIAGSLYVMGTLSDKSGNGLASLLGTTLTGFQTDADGLVATDSTGQRIPTDLVTGQNLFFGAPGLSADVPTSFPAAFPDANGNRVIDDIEYDAVAAQSVGTLGGGMIYEVPLAGLLSGGVPAAGNRTAVAGRAAGHLVLVDTAANPISIDGQVAVPGDIVLRGVVKGAGSIWARGNVYVIGDLTYADGTDSGGARTHGLAAGPEDGRPGLELNCDQRVTRYLGLADDATVAHVDARGRDQRAVLRTIITDTPGHLAPASTPTVGTSPSVSVTSATQPLGI